MITRVLRHGIGVLTLTMGSHAIATAPGTAVTVHVRGFRFTPDSLTVARGTRLRFENADDIVHTVTFGTPDAPDRRLAAGTLAARGTVHELVARAPGTFSYYCERHPFMTGHLRIHTDTTPT